MKISILTPSFNSVKYLERAIRSVMAQDYDEWEHIVVDGGSTDGTVEILKKYPHLKWVSEPDRGQSDAMNKAFTMSSGEVIAYLNADDEFAESAFSRVAGVFRENAGYQVVIGGLITVGVDKSEKKAMPGKELKDILEFDQWNFPLNPSCYFYKREVQLAVGNFPERYHYAMDYWLVLQLYEKFKICFIPEVLGRFYMYADNKSASPDRSMDELAVILLDFLRGKGGDFEGLKEKWHHFLINRYINHCKNFSTVNRQLMRYISDMPMKKRHIIVALTGYFRAIKKCLQ